MKKYLTISTLSIILCLTTSSAQAPNPPKPRMVTITLTENTWRVLFFVVNKADVPHPTVTALQDSLYSQFNQQLADTTKKK